MIIVLEGLDGSGKSTLAKLLADHYRGTVVHYPVDPKLVEEVAPVFGKEYGHALDFLLHPPSDRSHQVTICDRYYQSHFAYGGTYYDTLLERLPSPTYSFLLGVPPELSLERCKARGTDDIDMPLEVRQKVWDNYLSLKRPEWTLYLPAHFSPKDNLHIITQYVQCDLQAQSTDIRLTRKSGSNSLRVDS